MQSTFVPLFHMLPSVYNEDGLNIVEIVVHFRFVVDIVQHRLHVKQTIRHF